MNALIDFDSIYPADFIFGKDFKYTGTIIFIKFAFPFIVYFCVWVTVFFAQGLKGNNVNIYIYGALIKGTSLFKILI